MAVCATPSIRLVPKRRRCATLFACVLAALAALAPVSRAAADDSLEIRSAVLQPVAGVYQLDAQMQFKLPEGARQAVHDGVVLTMNIDLELLRTRRWWLDETVASLEQKYEIVYHALSEQYLLRNLNSGEQSAFATLDAALDALSTIRDLPIIDQALLNRNEHYEARIRATLDVRTLPETLRWVLFWTESWRQRSDWYEWPLKQ